MSQPPPPHSAGQTPCPDDPSATPLARECAAQGTALLIIDMMGDWRFPGAQDLLERAVAIAPAIQSLKARCKAAQVPVIYANDNHGRWRSDARALVEEGLAAGGDRAQLAQWLRPEDDDYFVLKPKHSAFFATPLDLLLSHLKAHRLILTGTASDQCVLATAIDGRMRDYELLCPRDCLAATDEQRHANAMRHLAEVLRLDTTDSTELRLPGES
jgi:nicotinamidase-related amidase